MKDIFITWPGRLAKELNIPMEEAKALWHTPTPGAGRALLPWTVVIVCFGLPIFLRYWNPMWVYIEPYRTTANSMTIFGAIFGTQLFMRTKLRLIVQRYKAQSNSPLHTDPQAGL